MCIYIYNLGQNICSRRFNHVSRSRISKNLNLRKKADPNFRGNLRKNHFRHLNLYSNPSS